MPLSAQYCVCSMTISDGKATTHKFKIADNIFRDAPPLTNRAGELHLDSCWRAATGSSHNNNNNSNNNTGQLISAILNGHAARVIVDDVALTLDQVSVAGDVVVFGALQYLDPVGSGAYTRDSMVVHVVATSQGQVFTCKTLPQDGTPFYNTTSAGTVTWFVDTRQQSRVYSVTSQGEVLLGQESELYAAAAKGATVHVGIVFSEPNHYLLMPVSILKLTSDDHVVAQVEGLSRLPIMEGRVTPWLDCGLRALLVTSQGTVRLYEYRHREPGTHTNLTALTIHWFVDSYADN
ncbi:uncharacterized protein [Littorina saxatilis]|uniref:uncharacterized protein n=1 Tax=Littorina saxatilis TaxID=31220 RepID=UPI0038B5F595